MKYNYKEIQKWRDERINKIISKSTPLKLNSDEAILAIHLIPCSFNDLNTNTDFNKLKTHKEYFLPLSLDRDSKKLYIENYIDNYDGYVLHSTKEPKALQRAYTQIFHSGAIESVESTSEPPSDLQQGIKGMISIKRIRDLIVNCGKEYIDGLNKSEVSIPVVMSVSLLNIKNYGLGLGYDRVNITVQEERLIFTEIVFENLFINENEYKELIKPLLDHLANTVGQESIN